MTVAGIDFSTRFVDIVLLDDDTDAVEHHRFGLADTTPFFAARSVRAFTPAVGWWEEKNVWLIGIENPYSVSKGTAKALGMIAGALAVRLPQGITVVQVEPAEWKTETAGSASASKEATREWSLEHGAPEGWPQDAHDAHCVAFTVRMLNQRALERAA